MRLSGRQGPGDQPWSVMRAGSQLLSRGAETQGSYSAFKVAVAIIVFHFICKLLVQFADILLPFIMALLLTSIFEPVKQMVLTNIECTILLIFRNLNCFGCCLRNQRDERRGGRIKDNTDLGDITKRFCLFAAIIFTLCFAGRLFWLICRIVWLSAEAVSHDFEYYQLGVQKRQEQVQQAMAKIGLKGKVQLDTDHIAKYALIILKYVAEFFTTHVFYTVSQISLTTIFVVFLLYSPVQRDFSPVMQGVFGAMEHYLKLKSLISFCMGITNGCALAIVGLEIPAAWGLMTFMANFIPNIGGPMVSVIPCVIALLDARKTLLQVLVAFLAQFVLHFTIANFVEPIVFGTTEEIHSVVVLLGLSFFGYIWGFTGMFLSVPLLFALHAWLEIVARSPKHPMEAREDARFVMGMLEGSWLSDSLESEPNENPNVTVLEGSMEPVEGSTDQSRSGQLPGDLLHGEPPMGGSAARCDCRELEAFDSETGQIRVQALIGRWLLLIVVSMILFCYTDPALPALIHPSGASGRQVIIAIGNSTSLEPAVVTTTSSTAAGTLRGVLASTPLLAGVSTTLKPHAAHAAGKNESSYKSGHWES